MGKRPDGQSWREHDANLGRNVRSSSNMDWPVQRFVAVEFDENGPLVCARTQGLRVKDMIVSTGKDAVRVCYVESCEIRKNSG